MKHIFTLALLLSIAFPVIAMDDGQNDEKRDMESLRSLHSNNRDKRKPRPVTVALNSGAYYIGSGPSRDKIDQLYGKKFSQDTVFFLFRFADAFGYNKPDFDEGYIPYDLIKDVKEGDSIELTINNKKVVFEWRQQSNWCKTPKAPLFEEMVAREMASFKKQAEWLFDSDSSQPSLIEAGVIDLNSATRHGENCSPFVKESK